MNVVVVNSHESLAARAARYLIQAGHEVTPLNPPAIGAATSLAERQATIAGAFEGCDAILNLSLITEESGPDLTFHSVNVEGTRHLVAEAERVGCRRFVQLSSLGIHGPQGPLQRSLQDAEEIVRSFPSEWLIVRTGNVFYPRDDTIELLINMIRTMPAVPVIAGGEGLMEPIWVEDLGNALAQAVLHGDLSGQTIEVTGEDLVSLNDVIDRLSPLLNKDPAKVSMPGWLATGAANFLSSIGVKSPLAPEQIAALENVNHGQRRGPNALKSVLQVEPTPLDVVLRMIVDGTALAEESV